MRLPLSIRFAGRELRSGVRGFGIFLACLALGVAAMAAAGSTAEAFRRGLAVQARELLGGDIAISVDRVFTDKERAVFGRAGRVAYSAAARAMAETPSGERRMVELRGVDAAYPWPAGWSWPTPPAGRWPSTRCWRPRGPFPARPWSRPCSTGWA